MTTKNFEPNKLNKNLNIFFTDALKVAVKNPVQAYYFFRSIRWMKKASRIRSVMKEQNIEVPPIIIFSVTNECNLECKGCYAHFLHKSNGEELSDVKLRKIVEEAEELGVSFFVIAGGEPFIRPEILKIMKDFPKMIFLVFTNGTLIDDNLRNDLKKHKNIIPLVSLEGDREHTDFRRGDGTFSFITEIMSSMKKNKLFFGNSITLTRMNFDTVMEDSFIKNLVDHGCRFFLFLEYTPADENTNDWLLSEDQRSKVKDLLIEYRKKYPALFIGVPWDEENIGGCMSAGRGFVHINASGDLEPCPFAPYSDINLKNSSLKNALQSDFLKTLRNLEGLNQETGGGCVLWQNRELVKSILGKHTKTKSTKKAKVA